MLWERIPKVSKIIVSVINEMVLFVVISLENEFSYWDLCPFCLAGPHWFPGEEVLFVRKDNIDGEAITYEKKRDLAGYMITLHECQQISNFVYQGKFQLMSVLWLLSEFALTKFCKERE